MLLNIYCLIAVLYSAEHHHITVQYTRSAICTIGRWTWLALVLSYPVQRRTSTGPLAVCSPCCTVICRALGCVAPHWTLMNRIPGYMALLYCNVQYRTLVVFLLLCCTVQDP
jgi:hypothetical protein